MPTEETAQTSPTKRRRGPQSNTATEMRAHNQIVTALRSIEDPDGRARVLRSACLMAQVPSLANTSGVPFTTALSSRDTDS